MLDFVNILVHLKTFIVKCEINENFSHLSLGRVELNGYPLIEVKHWSRPIRSLRLKNQNFLNC